jgi:hypothetical protein
MGTSRKEVAVEEAVKNDEDRIDWAFELRVGRKVAAFVQFRQPVLVRVSNQIGER